MAIRLIMRTRLTDVNKQNTVAAAGMEDLQLFKPS